MHGEARRNARRDQAKAESKGENVSLLKQQLVYLLIVTHACGPKKKQANHQNNTSISAILAVDHDRLLLREDTDSAATTASGTGVLTTDLESPPMTKTTVSAGGGVKEEERAKS